MYRIRKKFTFEMAHQLSKAYSSACSDCIHGHSYDLELFFVSEKLDETGMIIDFGKIKALLKEYIDKWDHAIVMHTAMDPEYIETLKRYNSKVIELSENPTAEIMARLMFNDISNILIAEMRMGEFELEKVRLHETRTGWAEFQG